MTFLVLGAGRRRALAGLVRRLLLLLHGGLFLPTSRRWARSSTSAVRPGRGFGDPRRLRLALRPSSDSVPCRTDLFLGHLVDQHPHWARTNPIELEPFSPSG